MKKHELASYPEADGIRLNKYLSDAGFCSRREADRLVEQGKVRIDGTIAVLGQRVMKGQRVECNGQVVSIQEKMVLIAFNKPRGIECTSNRKVNNNIVDYINYPTRIYPIGRLDKDSNGLILLTNDGDIVNRILKASNYHEKEYEVVVDKPVTKEFVSNMEKGVAILDTVTRPCKIRVISRYKFDIIITQGLNRQIRRMCEACGFHVRQLKRVRIMNITLGNLKEGTYRDLTKKEYEELINQLRGSHC